MLIIYDKAILDINMADLFFLNVLFKFYNVLFHDFKIGILCQLKKSEKNKEYNS